MVHPRWPATPALRRVISHRRSAHLLRDSNLVANGGTADVARSTNQSLFVPHHVEPKDYDVVNHASHEHKEERSPRLLGPRALAEPGRVASRKGHLDA